MFELNIDNVLKYGTMLCDNILEDFPEGMINPLPYRFDYHKGVLLSGMEKMSKLVNKEKYEDFIKSWIDLVVTEDGVVQNNGKGWCSFESGIGIYFALNSKFSFENKGIKILT